MLRLVLGSILLFVGACVSDTTLSIPLSKEAVAISVPVHAPRRGPAAARVTLVEFSDFQCVYCAQAEPTVQKVLATYPDDVALVYVNFPLTSIHANALPAAQAFLAAARQGQAWPMHDIMFQHHNSLSEANLVSWAQSLGMDVTQFNADRASAEIAAEIAQDKALAISLDVEATPTFFINGRKLPGAQPFSAFQKGIEEELGHTSEGQ